jgi:S-adenosylmethionine:tRNA ribosyltransferase-isomerase
LLTSDFDFSLPQELIAQSPATHRDHSRLLVLNRATDQISHRRFCDLPEFLRPGDVLVLNDSKVIPARLRGKNTRTGGAFEILLLEEITKNDWWVMMRPAKRARPGTIIQILHKTQCASPFEATVQEVNSEGHRRLHFSGSGDILTALDDLGEVPLPPYIQRIEEQPTDRERYQTIYAQAPGSVAAPTAGLHFTAELLQKIQARGVNVCCLTLHVGLGTFAPVKARRLADHLMHQERFLISPETARTIAAAKERGGRIVAAGTTTLRALESARGAGAGRTALFIYPPFHFNMVDCLVTNFHLPRSTLLMLAAAFAAPDETRGRERILRAYQEAIAQRYRFFSYGDAMLLL